MSTPTNSSDRSFRAVWQAWRTSQEGKACLDFNNMKSAADLENRLKAAFAEGWHSAPCELPAEIAALSKASAASSS